MNHCTQFTNAFTEFFESTMKATEEYMAGISGIYIRRNEITNQQIYPTFKLVNQTKSRGRPKRETQTAIKNDANLTEIEQPTEISNESEADDSQVDDTDDSQIEEIPEITSAPKKQEAQEISQIPNGLHEEKFPQPTEPARPTNAPVLSAQFFEKLKSFTNLSGTSEYQAQKMQTPPGLQRIQEQNKTKVQPFKIPLYVPPIRPLGPIPTITDISNNPTIAPVAIKEPLFTNHNNKPNPINDLPIVSAQDIPPIPTPVITNNTTPVLNNDSLSSLVAGLCADSTDDLPDSSPTNAPKAGDTFASDEEDSQGVAIEDTPLASAPELCGEYVRAVIELPEPSEEEELLLRIQEYATNAFPRFRRSQRIDFVNYLYHDLGQTASKEMIGRQVDVMYRYGLLQ